MALQFAIVFHYNHEHALNTRMQFLLHLTALMKLFTNILTQLKHITIIDLVFSVTADFSYLSH